MAAVDEWRALVAERGGKRARMRRALAGWALRELSDAWRTVSPRPSPRPNPNPNPNPNPYP